MVGCRGTSRDLPNLEFAHDQHTLGPVDITAAEGDHLPNSHAGGRQQADHASGTWPPEAAWGRRCGTTAISVLMSASE